MSDNWTRTLALISFGLILGVVLEILSLVSGVRRYTGRESITVSPEVAISTFVVAGVFYVLFVGLLATAENE